MFGFGFLGLVDDLVAVGNDRGFRGHLGALRHGRVTTGLLKLVGGVCVAVVLVATPGFKTGRTLLVDGVLIALAANLGNLLDRAPGPHDQGRGRRVCAARVRAGRRARPVSRSRWSWAPRSGLLGDDLRERLMLGDTGANVIGAVLGLARRARHERDHAPDRDGGCSSRLNVAAELVSFSTVIDRVPPLRWLDRAWPQAAPSANPSTNPPH